MLGTLAHQVGRNDVAVELIQAAIRIDQRQAAYHTNLGATLQTLAGWRKRRKRTSKLWHSNLISPRRR